MLSFVLYNRDLDVRKYADTPMVPVLVPSIRSCPRHPLIIRYRALGLMITLAPGVNNNTENIQSGRDEREFLEDFLSSEAVDRYMVLKKVSYGCCGLDYCSASLYFGRRATRVIHFLAGREEITATTIGHSARLLAIIGAVIYRSPSLISHGV